MSRKSGTEITFQEKFKDRMENMGKDGVLGIMKNTEIPVNKNEYNNKMDNWNLFHNDVNIKNREYNTNNGIITSKESNKEGKRNSTNIGTNGKLIVGNNMNSVGMNISKNVNPGIQNNIMNMNSYMVSLNQQMHNPLMNHSYLGNNMIVNPMIQMNPIIYNPYQIMMTPMSNVNRNLMTNYGIAPNNNINIPNNQPVKILNNNIPITMIDVTKEGNNHKSQQRSITSKNRSGMSNNIIENNMNNSKLISNHNEHSMQRRNKSSTINTCEGSYKPYTLKDYKEITSAKIVLGGLGPNIGNQEWEKRQTKIKKMGEYSTILKETNKSSLFIKNGSLQENVEKIKRVKIENSNRFKSYEYAKLIKPKPNTSNNPESIYSGLGLEVIRENPENENNLKYMGDFQNRSRKNIPSNENIYKFNSKQSIFNNNNMSTSNNLNDLGTSESNLQTLLKQRETYNLKINGIKESLLN